MDAVFYECFLLCFSRLRSRHPINNQAVLLIQRAFRSHLKNKKATEQQKAEQKRILEKHRKRWKKKIEGDDYVADSEDDAPEDTFEMQQMNTELEPLAGKARLSQEYEYKRRKDFLNDNNLKGNFFEIGGNNVQIESSHDHRRKRFDDLKSVQDRKKEMDINERLMRSFD